MKRLFFFVLVLAPLSLVNSFADTTWVEGEVSGIWSTDGSPYILTGRERAIWIAENDTLIIEPGVEVLFESSHELVVEGAKLITEGTADDSIFFRDIDNRYGWSYISIEGDSDFRASFCEFRLKGCDMELDIGSVSIFGGEELTATLSHCTFVTSSIGLRTSRNSNVFVTDCYFTYSGLPVRERLRGGFSLIQRCVIYGSMRVFRGEICNNWSGALYAYNETSVFNNILVCHRIALSGIDDNVEYNCFMFNDQEFENVDIEGIGILDRVNANGDSTDRYGNLFQDPLQVGPIDSVWIYPDSYYLTSDSPCIDAGDPESDPDPDGTRADIGAFFYPQCNIDVEPDTVEFIGVQIDEIVELELEIMNIGVLPLQIESWTIHPVNMPFSINDLEQEFELSPDSSRVVTISFAPLVEQRYEASLLIESNDRDEDILEIPLVGTALGVGLSDEALPTEFAAMGIYPNPFNSSTEIGYSLPFEADVSISIYDVSGCLITELINNRQTPGNHSAIWFGMNQAGNPVSSGVYFYRFIAKNDNNVQYRNIHRMVLLK
ncbi:MAG: T9SS type A sorting domain-containing protein [Candidatus Hatepunaea meridiana]|nr:T9SS type A sorting domain-containing protein [Candidatus Hatepunaea meridiana]